MKSNIKFKMAARCEPAGRPNNEDNFLVIDNLSSGQKSFSTDTEISLNEKGALMVVCDGMGGMNAGEVASDIAVKTIEEWFSPARLSDSILSSSDSIRRYIEKAIVAADANIKKEAQNDREKDGMGTTIVLAWIIGEKIYVAWCGDSRAYCFNPNGGLRQLSTDHSYVQELVTAKKLSEDLAFDHPDSNIITRCLGDPGRTAKPDFFEDFLHNGDIILLCSDGLCGILRKKEIEETVNSHQNSMADCRDALWNAAREAGWRDNVTIELCKTVSGAKQYLPPPVKKSGKRNRSILIPVLCLLIGCVTGGAGGWFSNEFYAVSQNKERKEEVKVKIDSILKVCQDKLFEQKQKTLKTLTANNKLLGDLKKKIDTCTIINSLETVEQEISTQIAELTKPPSVTTNSKSGKQGASSESTTLSPIIKIGDIEYNVVDKDGKQYVVYTVVSGDTLNDIIIKFNNHYTSKGIKTVNVVDVKDENGGDVQNPAQINIGDKYRIPYIKNN